MMKERGYQVYLTTRNRDDVVATESPVEGHVEYREPEDTATFELIKFVFLLVCVFSRKAWFLSILLIEVTNLILNLTLTTVEAVSSRLYQNS